MTPKIIDYKILSSVKDFQLEQNVVLFLQNGWQLYGPLSVTYSEDELEFLYTQALVKFDDDENFESHNNKGFITCH